MTTEEYEHIKEVGQDVGYVFEQKFDNLIDNYELKKQVIDISKNFAVTHDSLFLRNQLNNLNVSQEVRDALQVNIQRIINLKGDKLVVYSNSVYIPNDEEFIDNSKRLFGSKPLSELYHVPVNVIAAKTFEINKYGKISQKSHHGA